MVERPPVKRRVVGSNPTRGAKYYRLILTSKFVIVLYFDSEV